MMIRPTRSHLVAINIVVLLFAATHGLSVWNRNLQHGLSWSSNQQRKPLQRGLTIQKMIGGDRSYDLSYRKTIRKNLTGQQKRSVASPLFMGNKTNGAKIVSRVFTRRNFIIAGILFVLPPILLEIYSRVGTLSIRNDRKGKSEAIDTKDFSFVPPPKHTQWSNVENVAIVFHGAGGQDPYTDELMQKLEGKTESKASEQQSSYNHIVDWSKYSANILQASHNGQRIGKIAAEDLLEQLSAHNDKLKTIHFIGISVGAFAADAAAKEVKSSWSKSKNGGAPPFVQLTLLDPFQQRGVLGVGYGNKEFGKSVDYAEQYLNTDDPVPSTNKPLKNTVCYDVTNLRPESIFGHDWPLVYYSRSDRCGQLGIKPTEREKEGTVIVL